MFNIFGCIEPPVNQHLINIQNQNNFVIFDFIHNQEPPNTYNENHFILHRIKTSWDSTIMTFTPKDVNPTQHKPIPSL